MSRLKIVISGPASFPREIHCEISLQNGDTFSRIKTGLNRRNFHTAVVTKGEGYAKKPGYIYKLMFRARIRGCIRCSITISIIWYKSKFAIQELHK